MSSLGNSRGKGRNEGERSDHFPRKLDAVRVELERRGINATLTLINVQQAEERKTVPSPHTEVAGAFADRLKVLLQATPDR